MYADYYQVKLILYYLFTDLIDFLYIDRQVYKYFIEVFTACKVLYYYPEDYYYDPVDLDPINKSSSDLELKSQDDE